MTGGQNDDKFDWGAKNGDVIVPEQRSLAVYTNSFGQAVIREERCWDEERDTFIVISHGNLLDIIAALRKIADVEPSCDRD